MKQQKAYKYRFYPTEEQRYLLAKTFGCCRYVYNWALRQKSDAYYQRGERLSSHDLRGSNPRPMSEPPST